MIDVDVTPGAHNPLDAIGVVSFKLACGCTIPPSDPDPDDEIFLFKRPGAEYPCRKHGDQVITRSTVRLVGWKDRDDVHRGVRRAMGVRP